MLKNVKKSVLPILFILILCFTFALAACTPTNANGSENSNSGSADDGYVHASVARTSWKILEGKDSETTVYKYVTDKKGPKTVIVGGTHGDELAGWHTALDLVEEMSTIKGVCGEILLIPQVNIIADTEGKRYVSSYNGVEYSDLNRAFPLDRSETAAQATVEIADAVVATIEAFVGEDYKIEKDGDLCIVDLHESIASSATRLGSSLIYSNATFFMEDLREIYNDKYRLEGEDRFTNVDATQTGSFSYYFTHKYEDAVVFTVETNRARVNGVDTIDLSVRKRQQRNVLNALFDLAWER